MKDKKIILITTLLLVVLALIIWAANLSKTNTNLTKIVKEKDKQISQLRAQENTPFVHVNFQEAEKRIIEAIKNSEQYKSEENDVEPYAYLKFTNSGFITDGKWFYGSMRYANVYKETDDFNYIEGKPLASILDGYNYIVKFNYKGEIEKLEVMYLSPNEKWNQIVNELPENVMPQHQKSYMQLPSEN